MADIFHEVDEDLRRERLAKLWDRFAPYIVGVALLIVVGVGGWRANEYWQLRRSEAASTAFESAIALAESGQVAEADAAFASLSETAEIAAYRSMARLRRASLQTASDPKAAAAAFDAIAADNAVSRTFRDLAALRASFILVDSASFDEMRQRLEPLTGAQGTFRHSARELLALSAWRAGNMAEARRRSDEIVNDPESPAGLRQRMQALSALAGENKG